MANREPIDKLIASEQTDDQLKQRLLLVRRAREFASSELALPDNDSYRSYVDTGRDYITWNVVATEEFSIEANEWCFLVAGCVPYRGYYSRDVAEAFADDLDQQGLDVFVNGSTAYSTLGWFDDPVLNTMLNWRETRLVGVIFHELAHQQLWVKNDTTFNESFAVFVQREGVRRWLERYGTQSERDEFEQRLRRRETFITMLLDTRSELETLYASGREEQTMRVAKLQVLTDLRARYQALRTQWQGYSGYDYWFDKPINNARFVLISTYNDGVRAFAELFDAADRDFERFYARVAELAEATPTERARQLQEHGLNSATGAGS